MFKNLKQQIQSEGSSSQQHPKKMSAKMRETSTAVQKTTDTTAFLYPADKVQSRTSLNVQKIVDNNGTLSVEQLPESSSAPPTTNTLDNTVVTRIHSSPGNKNNASSTAADITKLKAQNHSLEQAYQSYRDKTADLLTKKDSHIQRLQERVKTLENKIEQREKGTAYYRDLESDHDELKVKLEQLEQDMISADKDFKERQDRTVKDCQEQLRQQSCDIQRELMQERTMTEERLAGEIDALKEQLASKTKECTKLLQDNKVMREDLNLSNGRVKSLTGENSQLKVELDKLIKKAQSLKSTVTEGPAVAQTLEVENMALKQQLDEVQDYADIIDIKSERQMTNMANQLEDLSMAMQNKERDITAMAQTMDGKEQEIGRLTQRIKSLEASVDRQKEIIENVREEIDSAKSECKEAVRERDDLLLRNATLSHELELVRTESSEECDKIKTELGEVARELKMYKQQLNGDTTSAIIDKLQRTNEHLEDTVKERDTTIRLQQQRLVDMKRTLQKELRSSISTTNLNTHQPASSSNESITNMFGAAHTNGKSTAKRGEDGNFTYLKHVLFMYLTSSDYECMQLVKAVSAVLHFTDEQEKAVWDNLKYKLSWLPASKPKRRV